MITTLPPASCLAEGCLKKIGNDKSDDHYDGSGSGGGGQEGTKGITAPSHLVAIRTTSHNQPEILHDIIAPCLHSCRLLPLR